MVSLRSQKVTDRALSSRKNEAGSCLPSAFGLLADNSSVASSNSSESEASEKTDRLGDLSPDDYSNSDVDSDEELPVESTQTSVLGSGSGLVNQVITGTYFTCELRTQASCAPKHQNAST
jgi:hypothetical protein